METEGSSETSMNFDQATEMFMRTYRGTLMGAYVQFVGKALQIRACHQKNQKFRLQMTQIRACHQKNQRIPFTDDINTRVSSKEPKNSVYR